MMLLHDLNKFDAMMLHLHLTMPGGLRQMVAADACFDILARAWCVAEVVKAHAVDMLQTLD